MGGDGSQYKEKKQRELLLGTARLRSTGDPLENCAGSPLGLFPLRDGRLGHFSTDWLGAALGLLGTCSLGKIPALEKRPQTEAERYALKADSSSDR